MDDIKIRKFKPEDLDSLLKFELGKHQSEYTSLPKQVIYEAIENPNCIPCVVENLEYCIVGFFLIHKNYQHDGFNTPAEAVYIRSLSINETKQGKGYGTNLALSIPSYVQKQIVNTDFLFLVVDYKNTAALNLYERAGFIHTASKELGPIGEERLYRLNLNHKFETKTSLYIDKEFSSSEIRINILDDKQYNIGYISGEFKNDKFLITNIFIQEANRRIGLALSALRHLNVFLKQNFKTIDEIIVNINKTNEKSSLFEKVGFVNFEETPEKYLFKKYL